MNIVIRINLPKLFGKLVLQKCAEHLKKTIRYTLTTQYNFDSESFLIITETNSNG